MRNVVVFSEKMMPLVTQNGSVERIALDGVPIACGLITTPDPAFDKNSPENRRRVFVRVKAFSCNYRDKSFIFLAHKKGHERSFYVLGSEFAGEVIDVGAEVTAFEIGDRVMGNNSYTGVGVDAHGNPEGTASSHASREYQVFHESKLMAVPSQMADPVAAAFAVAAQTAYGMIRRLEVREGTNVLVTAARSNTSLFAINALRRHNVRVTATSTSGGSADALRNMGNCLGLTEDLEQACRDYCSGSLAVTVDSIFCNNQVGAFLERSYKATDRFGKVVYEYT